MPHGDEQVILGKIVRCAPRPLDHRDTIPPKIVVDASRSDIAVAREAVQVDVGQRQPAFILVNDREGRTCDRICHTQTFGNSAGENRLSRPQVTIKQDDFTSSKHGAQPHANPMGLGRTVTHHVKFAVGTRHRWHLISFGSVVA